MPGITVVERPPERDVLDEVLESVRFGDDYARRDAVDDGETVVASTGYEGYPVEVFETDDYAVVLEGYLYGTDDVEAAATEAAEWIVEDRIERLSEWVAARDGDFLLTVFDRETGRTRVVNDAFGRLPTYRATVGETTVLTRELKVVRELARRLEGDLDPDRLALGQMLLFGYPLGTRTLFEGVEQVPPGSLLEVGSGEVRSVHEFRFDDHENAGRTLEANARILRDRFLEACENRGGVAAETVVSLSGGLDSRAVIAGHARADDGVTAATSARADGGNADEVDVARRVAGATDVPWRSYIAERSERQRETLLDMTQGMNNLGMSIGLDFAEQVAAERDDAVFVTGDGGDKAMPDLTPARDLESAADLVDAVVDGQQVFEPAEAADIVGVDAERLVDSVRDRVRGYPESTLEGKHVHFLVRERGINWLNHGEDRTRYRLWSTTPFYSLPFFAEAMACPPEQKRGTRLYREFLSLLSPDVVEIDYVDFGAPIDSLEYRVKRYGYDWLSERPAIKERVARILDRGGDSGSAAPERALVEATRNVSGFERHLSPEEVQRITWSNGAYSSEQRSILLTLVSALSDGAERAAPAAR